MKGKKVFDYNFETVRNALRILRGSGWYASADIEADELRLGRTAVTHASHGVMEAIADYAGKDIAPAKTLVKKIENARNIARLLRQNPDTVFSILASAMKLKRPVHHGFREIHCSMSRRRELFRACGLDPKDA